MVNSFTKSSVKILCRHLVGTKSSELKLFCQNTVCFCSAWQVFCIQCEFTRHILSSLFTLVGKGTDAKSRLAQLFDLVPEIRHIGMWHTEMMKQMKVNIQVQEVHQLFHNVSL